MTMSLIPMIETSVSHSPYDKIIIATIACIRTHWWHIQIYNEIKLADRCSQIDDRRGVCSCAAAEGSVWTCLRCCCSSWMKTLPPPLLGSLPHTCFVCLGALRLSLQRHLMFYRAGAATRGFYFIYLFFPLLPSLFLRQPDGGRCSALTGRGVTVMIVTS